MKILQKIGFTCFPRGKNSPLSVSLAGNNQRLSPDAFSWGPGEKIPSPGRRQLPLIILNLIILCPLKGIPARFRFVFARFRPFFERDRCLAQEVQMVLPSEETNHDYL